MNEIQRALYEHVKIIVEEYLKKLKYNYTKTGVVKSVDENIATVLIDEAESKCKIRSGLKLYPNDMVIVMIKQNDYSDKYVDGKLMEINEEVPPASGDIADAVAKKHFPYEVDGHRYTISETQPNTPKFLDVWISKFKEEGEDMAIMKLNIGTPQAPNWLELNSKNSDTVGGKGVDDFLPKLSGAELPTASETYRGKIFTKLGGENVADIAYLCVKGADNNYTWTALTELGE